MYKEGDKVQFIEHESLGKLSGRIGTIIGKLDDSKIAELGLYDNVFDSKHAYDVFVPLQPTISILDGFIKPYNQCEENE